MNIRKNDFQIGSKADGLLLSGMMLVPEERPHGVVQIVHGMSEHKERYLDFMTFLAKNGWIAVIHDNRGHGKSVKTKEDLGYFYEGGHEALVEDIEQVRAFVEEGLYEELPYVLLGHSMGSLAAVCIPDIVVINFDGQSFKACHAEVGHCLGKDRGQDKGRKSTFRAAGPFGVRFLRKEVCKREYALKLDMLGSRGREGL